MKEKLNLVYALFLLFSPLQAQENFLLQKDDAMIVNSGEAQYDGKEIVLVGKVVVQHGLGQISARRLSIQTPADKETKGKFSLLKISDDVQIEIKGGGKLYCQLAEVDYAKMQGVFLGNTIHPDVVYLNVGEGQEAGQTVKPPLEIKSNLMTFELTREPATSTSSAKTLVKQIEADHNVRVGYNHDHLILADHALYQRILTAQPSSLAGLLTLTAGQSLPVCKMTNVNGDNLSAQMIQVNTLERKLWLTQPKGILYLRQEERPTQTLEFSSYELSWDDQQQMLILKGQVEIIQNGTFHVLTDHEISISQAVINGKKTLRFLYAPQNTQISYLDVQKEMTHKIHCPGSFNIDHENQKMTFQGLKEKQEIQQVYIDDVLGELHADEVQMNYRWEGGQMVPEKMLLEGHVRLMNRFDGHLEESGSILHYALADRIEYFPKQQEMLLAGTHGNRVLFFDKVNNVQMSAPSLKIRRDATTKKDAIEGLGDVRFTFMEKELEQLKRHFSLTESSHKELKGAKSN